jgi:hypothetical protein
MAVKHSNFHGLSIIAVASCTPRLAMASAHNACHLTRKNGWKFLGFDACPALFFTLPLCTRVKQASRYAHCVTCYPNAAYHWERSELYFIAVFPCGYSLYTKCRLIYPPQVHAGPSQLACCLSQTHALHKAKACTFNSLLHMACLQTYND